MPSGRDSLRVVVIGDDGEEGMMSFMSGWEGGPFGNLAVAALIRPNERTGIRPLIPHSLSPTINYAFRYGT